MMSWLAVAAGGSLGALCRYAIALHIPVAPGKFPFATFTANVVGAFLMGVMFVVIVEKGWLPPQWRQFAMVGFLGALTTFSTFSLEAIHLLHGGYWKTAALYIGLSVVLCIAATFAGYWILQKN